MLERVLEDQSLEKLFHQSRMLIARFLAPGNIYVNCI